MRISFMGFEFAPGKVKYKDERFINLVEKFAPEKESPFFIELLKEDFVKADAVLINKKNILDFLIFDMEKIETRIANSQDQKEKELLQKCLSVLEKEKPLTEATFSADELSTIKNLAPFSLKPAVFAEPTEDIDALLEKVLQKAEIAFFYTVGKKEVHAWPFDKGSDIVTCAGKIHSDLARGFIRAEIVSYDDVMSTHNLQEAKTKGLVKTVDRSYIAQDGDIVEIKFNV